MGFGGGAEGQATREADGALLSLYSLQLAR